MKTFIYKWKLDNKEFTGSFDCSDENDLQNHVKKNGGQLIEIVSIKTDKDFSNKPSQKDMKKCPCCSEEIKNEAIKCKHCGEWLNKKDIKQGTRSTEGGFFKKITDNLVTAKEAEKIEKRYEDLSEAVRSSGTKKCPKCNKFYDDTWKVCMYCKEKLIPVVNINEEKERLKKEFEEVKIKKEEKDLYMARVSKRTRVCKKCGVEYIVDTPGNCPTSPSVTVKYFCDKCGEYLHGSPYMNFWGGIIEIPFGLLLICFGALLSVKNKAGMFVILSSCYLLYDAFKRIKTSIQAMGKIRSSRGDRE